MAVKSSKIEVNGVTVYATPTGVKVGNSKSRVVNPRDAFKSKSERRKLRKTLYRLGRLDLVKRSLS
jgi:hypothetical protein